jgi:hypothetical protein
MPGSKRARLLAATATSAFALVPAGASALPFHPGGSPHSSRAGAAREAVHARPAAASAALADLALPAMALPSPPPPPPRMRTGSRRPPSDADFDRLARCESNGRWQLDSGNGFYGGLQFLVSTWQALGGTGRPSDHPREVQIALARQEVSRHGWSAWPSCARQLGLR